MQQVAKHSVSAILCAQCLCRYVERGDRQQCPLFCRHRFLPVEYTDKKKDIEMTGICAFCYNNRMFGNDQNTFNRCGRHQGYIFDNKFYAHPSSMRRRFSNSNFIGECRSRMICYFSSLSTGFWFAVHFGFTHI